MTVQEILAYILVGAAVVYLLKKFFFKKKKKTSGHCDNDDCGCH
ncbi:FeoB-associated Cys-rich membrane protein [Flavobacterium sp. LaA7.5]|nr:FeoB-associated Cys-rich membrane protein [Flavobacterium salilacus subsp. altitudinum]